MIVKLDNTVLAGEGREGTMNLRLNGRILAQEAEGLRAEEIEVYNRKNRRTVMSFGRAYLFDDIADADVFMLEHATTVLTRGLVIFIAKSPAKEVERYLKNAVCRAFDARQIGVTVFIDYEIVGGKILTERPS